MLKSALAALFLGSSLVAFSQSSVDYANMREDVQALTQKVGDLSLRVEQLEHDNAELRAKNAGAAHDVVTIAQLNTAVSDLNAAIQSANASSKHEILEIVGTQMEKLAKQTNAALDSISARAPATAVTRAPEQAATSATTPGKDGVYYTVQKGDNLALITKKTGGKFQEIIDANKLADPSKIRLGQVLFIPGGK